MALPDRLSVTELNEVDGILTDVHEPTILHRYFADVDDLSRPDRSVSFCRFRRTDASWHVFEVQPHGVELQFMACPADGTGL